MEGDVDVLAPDAGGQAVSGVVGELNGFGGSAERHGGQDGAEDFLLGDDAGGMDVAEKSGWEIEAARGHGNVGLPAGGAFGDALIDKALDAVELNASDDGADVDGFVEGLADAECVHAIANFGDERLGDAFLHQEAGSGAADLALVEPDAVDEAFDGGVEVGVFENDEGRFAAELEREFFVAGGGGFANGAADFGGAGEGDFVDVGVGDEGFASRAVAGDDVDDAGRQIYFLANFGEG